MKIDLSTLEGYSIACAIRGPDFNAPRLKDVVTGYIRCLVGVECQGCVIRRYRLLLEVCDLCSDECSEESPGELAARIAREICGHKHLVSHYISHCRLALEYLKRENELADPLLQFVREGFWIGFWAQESIQLTGQITQALKRLARNEALAGIPLCGKEINGELGDGARGLSVGAFTIRRCSMSNVNKFNRIANDIENEHARNGTEINHDGEIVFVDTAWVCGAQEGDNME